MSNKRKKEEDYLKSTPRWVDTRFGYFGGPDTSFTIEGVILPITLPKQGNKSYERVGNQISMLKGELIMQLYPNETENNFYFPMLLRIALVWDKGWNSASTPLYYDDVFLYQDATSGTPSDWGSVDDVNASEETRFAIVKQWLISMPGFDTDSSGNFINWTPVDAHNYRTMIHECIDLKGLKSYFIDNDNADSSVSSGRLFMAFSANAHLFFNLTDPAWKWFGGFRLTWED